MTLDAATEILTNIALILLLGLIFSLVSKKLKISNVLILIILGMALGQLKLLGAPIMEFSSAFLIAIAVLTLVMVVFDGSSRFDLKMVNLYSLSSLNVTLFFLFFNVVFLSLFMLFLFFEEFSIEKILFAMVFAILMSGTDPGSVFVMLKNKTNRVIEFLEIEAIINTPIMVILPFVILDIINNLGAEEVAAAVFGQVVPLLQQVIVGIGSGVVIGLIVFKSMKKFYSHRFSPIGLITAALLAYIVAENLDGNGVLAVATLGLFFGHIYVKQKEALQEFSSVFSNGLVILVFILIGSIVPVTFSGIFLLKALVLYAVLILTRLVAVSFGLGKSDFSLKEKLFMILYTPKGIAVAVVAFSLSVFPVPYSLIEVRTIILQLLLLTMVYSLIVSSIIGRFSQRFIRVKLEK